MNAHAGHRTVSGHEVGTTSGAGGNVTAVRTSRGHHVYLMRVRLFCLILTARDEICEDYRAARVWEGGAA